MKNIDKHTGLVVLLAAGILGGAAYYFNKTTSTGTVEQTTAPIVVLDPITIEVSLDAGTGGVGGTGGTGGVGGIIDLPELIVVGRVNTEPFRHGTKACQWYEDAGMRAVAQLDGYAESTCNGNTCFLLVHDSGMPAGPVMLAWISEARSNKRDPRKEGVELSVFTFEDGEETDHVTYFPKRDVFESY